MKNYSFTKANADDFSDTIKEGPSFVLIYTPRCGWCKKILPIWDSLITKFESDEFIGNIIKVNAVEVKSVSKEIKSFARGVPAILIINNLGAVVANHKGKRTVESLEKFCLDNISKDPEKVAEMAPVPSRPPPHVIKMRRANFHLNRNKQAINKAKNILKKKTEAHNNAPSEKTQKELESAKESLKKAEEQQKKLTQTLNKIKEEEKQFKEDKLKADAANADKNKSKAPAPAPAPAPKDSKTNINDVKEITKKRNMLKKQAMLKKRRNIKFMM